MIRELIGLLVLLMLASFYGIYSQKNVGPNEAVRIVGRLDDEPFYGITGGDFKYPFVGLTLIGHTGDFEIEECSYDKLNHTNLNRLTSGDSVSLLVSRDRIDSRWCIVSETRNFCYSLFHDGLP